MVSDSTLILVHQEFVQAALRMPDYLPFLEIFLAMLGLGLTIVFCTTFCKMCSRFREEQREVTMRRNSDLEDRPPPIYIIPFPGMSQHDSEDHLRVPRHSQELHSPPPRYSTTVYSEAPPSYNELGFKPDELPPAYTEYDTPVYPMTPPPHTDMVQPQTQSQQ